MSARQHLAKILGLVTATALAVGFAAPAHASPVPPTASTALLGTWVNTNSASRSVKQVVITPNRTGNVNVDAFGSCTPTLCEWGRVPATVYGTSVTARTGASFQTNQAFLANDTEWSRTTLLGTVTRTRAGLRLSLRELTVFEDGSGRMNYTVSETFKRGDGQKPTKLGNPVSSYTRGAPPALVAGAFGSWTNPSASANLVAIKITGSVAHPVVQAFGRCSPTPCNWGRTKGIAFGPTISATRGATLFAPYVFGFKKSQLVITYRLDAKKVAHLTVSEYSEFTDGSSRSNYLGQDAFVRA